MTPHLRNKKSILDKFNTLSLTNRVSIKYKNFDVQLHTIFNGKSYQKGGKNYMSCDGIQCLSKHMRSQVTINGVDTVIYDFQGFEPSIAYSMAQEVYTDDPYDLPIDGYDPKISRKLCKLFMLVMMNIKGKTYIRAALNSMISKEFDIDSLYANELIPTKRIDTKTILEMVEAKHYKIYDMFYGASNSSPAYTVLATSSAQGAKLD